MTFTLAENSASGTVVGAVSATNPVSITGGNSGGAFAVNSATGQLTVANAAALDFETTPVFNLTVADSDGTANVQVNLGDVNEAPVNSVPGAQSVSVGQAIVFSTANGNAFSVTDDSSANGVLQVTLTASRGTLTLAGTAGLTFSAGDGTADQSMTFRGTRTNIVAALNGLVYTATSAGTGTLTMMTSDLGSSASNPNGDASGQVANGGFESPFIGAGGLGFPATIPGWTTTDSAFEVWGTGFQGVPAFEGIQFIELNAHQPGTVSTTVQPAAGRPIEFAFAHRARGAGSEVIRVRVTDLGPDGVVGGGNDTTLLDENFSDVRTAWGSYQRNLGFASGNKIRLQFTAVAPAGSSGNFLDNVRFGATSLTDTDTVSINNVSNNPPTIASNAAAVSANEGGVLTNTGTFNDAQGRSTVTITASVGTVTKNDAASTWSWSLNAADGPAGPITVTIRATDNQGAAANTTFTYAINNVPPTISLSGNATVNEGSPYTLNLGVVTDPGADTITSYKVTWGDGTFDTFRGSPVNTTATHTYADGPNKQTHNVTVTDDDGTHLASSLSVLVLNVAPTIALTGNVSVNEGSSYTLNLGADTVSAYSINWGDGNTENFNGNPANTTRTHTYADGLYGYIISMSLTDEDGTHANAGGMFVTVENVAPTIDLTGNTSVNEGSSYTLNLGAKTDPGADTVSAYSISWGDGNTENFSGVPSGSKTHTYADGPNGYTITVSMTDEDGTFTGGTQVVTVNNVAPTAPADNNSAANQVIENAANGTVVGVTANSTDPGVLDTVSYSLTDNAGGRFAIHASTGVITVANGSLLDYEAATSHNITVEASDGQGASTQTFTINLLNVTAVISGTVFVDVDGDGLFDGGTENGIDGVTVELRNGDGTTLLATNVTEMGGVYAFTVNDEFGTYRVREIQPTGVTSGAAILGSAAVDSVVSSNEMQLTLAAVDVSDYDFTEVGGSVQAGDTASIGFWQNKHGQALINQGGAALVNWLSGNFGNIFGTTFTNGSGGDNAAEVASFYKNEFFTKKIHGTSKVDAQFMATALAAFFTSSNLSGGSVATGYGFNVSATGISTRVVNVGSSGAAFGVANNTNMTIMSLLLATNNLTGASNNGSYRNAYDLNGDGILDANELALRAQANAIYSAINGG